MGKHTSNVLAILLCSTENEARRRIDFLHKRRQLINIFLGERNKTMTSKCLLFFFVELLLTLLLESGISLSGSKFI